MPGCGAPVFDYYTVILLSMVFQYQFLITTYHNAINIKLADAVADAVAVALF